MDETDHGRQLILDSRGQLDFAHGQPGVFERLQHTEGILQVEDKPWWDRIVLGMAHGAQCGARV